MGRCWLVLVSADWFYFHRHSASTAANKAFIVNRVGEPDSFSARLRFPGIWARSASLTSTRWCVVDNSRSAIRCSRPPRCCCLLSLRQVGAASSLCLASGCHGRSHTGFSADPCRDHGDGGRVHGGPFECCLCAGSDCDENRGHHRRAHRGVCGIYCAGAERYQARACLLHHLATGIYVSGARCGAFAAGVFHVFTHAFFKALLSSVRVR